VIGCFHLRLERFAMSKKPSKKPNSKKPKAESQGHAPTEPQGLSPEELENIQQELLRLQGRLGFTPLQPAESPASALDALTDWPEQWLSLVEQQQPKAHVLSPALTAFKEQTLYLAKHCEKQGMDASALVEYARELQRTYFALRQDLPPEGDSVWVLLERLKLRLEPFEVEGKSDNKPTTPIPNDQANLLVQDYLEANPNASTSEVVAAIKKHGGFSQGRLSKLPSWRVVVEKREAEKAKQKPKGKQERRLTSLMLGAIPAGDNPAKIAEALDEVRVNGWQSLLEEASPDERARLHEMPQQDRDDLIAARLDQWREQQRDDDQYEDDG
jgi:hypothetical protein